MHTSKGYASFSIKISKNALKLQFNKLIEITSLRVSLIRIGYLPDYKKIEADNKKS